MARESNVDVVWMFYHHVTRNSIQVMLRSNGRFNCGAFAANYSENGGGHDNSAAFSVASLDDMYRCFD
jgi:nanoRNase/pAp phosphatase (c-di-AMP/oligoRNAs hydrolase)